jgi:hypothetical protein
MDFKITIDDTLLLQVNTAIKASHSRLAADQQMENLPDFGEPEIKAMIANVLQSFILQDAVQATEILQRQAAQTLQEAIQTAISVKAV